MEKQSKTLVLDSSYTPRGIISSLRAFTIVYKGNANIVHEHKESFKLCDPELIIKKPSIIRVPKYVYTKNHKVPMTRRNIYRRDENMCVYCGEKMNRELTLDHVIPRCKGGQNTWENLVTACKDCNNEKGDMSFEEYCISINKDIKYPKKPHYLRLLSNIKETPEEWKIYLNY